jgi:heptose I phosphotransferase
MRPTPPTPVPTPASSLWRRLTRGRRLVRHDSDWPAFAGAGWADRVMAESVPDRFHAKQGRSIGRWTLAHGGRTLVVYLKRHYVLPRRHGLLAALWPSRAWSPGLQEWEHLNWARANGFPVPRTPAVGELLDPWGRLQSFLAVEELPDMLPLHEAIPLAQNRLPADEFARWKRGLVAELARLARELHRRSAFHQDLYLCHFYVADADCAAVPAVARPRVHDRLPPPRPAPPRPPLVAGERPGATALLDVRRARRHAARPRPLLEAVPRRRSRAALASLARRMESRALRATQLKNANDE